MKVLLDTHALLWATHFPDKLSRCAASVIANETSEILVSAASAWEIATKVRLGRMPEAAKFELNFLERVRDAGYSLLAVTVEDGLRAGRLIGEHQDPFDRMIAAQALADDIAVISADAKLDGFGVRRIW
jgi:PIN domain nuclease of toxin-antitoxin system